MKSVAILYVSHHGQTRKICSRIAAVLTARGHKAALIDLRSVREPFDFTPYTAALLAASVEVGKLQPKAAAFAKRHSRELVRLGAPLIAVSLRQAVAEDSARPELERRDARDVVREVLENFFLETGWRPAKVEAVAGALVYSEYGFLTRAIMKHIARVRGLPVDTHHDYDFTDWDAVERLGLELADALASEAPRISPWRASCAGAG